MVSTPWKQPEERYGVASIPSCNSCSSPTCPSWNEALSLDRTELAHTLLCRHSSQALPHQEKKSLPSPALDSDQPHPDLPSPHGPQHHPIHPWAQRGNIQVGAFSKTPRSQGKGLSQDSDMKQLLVGTQHSGQRHMP